MPVGQTVDNGVVPTAGITRALHEKFSILISCLAQIGKDHIEDSYLGEFKAGYSRSMTTYAVDQLRNYVHTIHGKA